MKYSEQFQTSSLGAFWFNLNSIFDPNRTGTGHQPYGFDTLATLYNRYRVISCSYRIQPVITGSSNTQNILLSAMPANEEVIFTTMSEARENPRCKYVTQTTGGGAVTLWGSSYIPSLVGRTKAQYMADDRYQALVTGNPQELAILNIQSAVGSDSPSSTTLQIVMEYTVEFFDIKHLSQS